MKSNGVVPEFASLASHIADADARLVVHDGDDRLAVGDLRTSLAFRRLTKNVSLELSSAVADHGDQDRLAHLVLGEGQLAARRRYSRCPRSPFRWQCCNSR